MKFRRTNPESALKLGLCFCAALFGGPGLTLATQEYSVLFVSAGWTRVREILAADGQTAQGWGGEFAAIKLDGPVCEGAREDFTDLRVVSDSGDEVASTVVTRQSATPESLGTKLLSQEQEQAERASVVLLDLSHAKLPTVRAEFETDATNFHRRLQIDGSNDAAGLKSGGERLWRQVGGGEIFDIRIDRRRSRQLHVDYPEARFRYLRVKIFNYDDRPIKISAVTVSGHPRYLLFRREAGRSYRLFYGNPLAAPPRYDIEQLAAYLNLEKLPVVRLGDERRLEPAARSEETRPPRGPLWLWAALIAAAAVLGTLIYRLARAVGEPPQ